MVRERAAAERAHQARARPASLPGQVPAAAGRGADPPPLPAGRARARSVLRLGDDARRGRRARARRGGLRHLGLQRAALAREDATARRRGSRRRPRGDAGARRGLGGRGAGRRARLPGGVVRRGRPARTAGLSTRDRARHRVERPRLARADARRALGAPRPPRRARRCAHAGARALLVPQAPPHLRAHGRRAALPAPLLETTSRTAWPRSASCARRAPRPRCCTSMRASCAWSGRPTRSSPRRPTSASSTTTTSTPTPTRCSGCTPRPHEEIGSRSRGSAAAPSAPTPTTWWPR